MASILGRFKDIMAANVNSWMDGLEGKNAEKMIDQYLRNAEDNLYQVKSETASVMAVEKSAERKLNECKADIEKYGKYAEAALSKGNEGDARAFLSKQAECENILASLETTYASAHTNAENMRAMHDKLVKDIDALKSKRDALKAQIQVAKTQETINKMTGASVDRANGSIDAFSRMEETINKRLDKANAEAELNQKNHTLKDLEEQYSTGGSSTTVDDKLAALKAKMGK